MSLVALVKTAKHLIVKKEPLKGIHSESIGNMSFVALVNTTNHLFVRREPLISTPRTNCVNMSLVALVNTTNHLFVRREPLISTPRTNCEHVPGPWSCWLTQQTTYLYAENHLFQHGRPTLILSSSHWWERCLALSLCQGR